jgi:hypothetical protein
VLNQYDVPISFQEPKRIADLFGGMKRLDLIGAFLLARTFDCAYLHPHTATLRPVIDDVIHHTNKSERICLISIFIQGCVWPCSSFYVPKFAFVLQLQHRSNAVREPS